MTTSSTDIDNFNIFETAKNKNCSNILEMVLDNLSIYNFHVNSQDEDGNTLLQLVIEHQENNSLIVQLLALNADVNIRNRMKQTPLYLACQKGNLKLVRQLIRQDANIHCKDTKNRSLLHIAVLNNNLELCKFLLQNKIDPNSQDNNGSTPLHYAVELKLQKVTFLLAHKADINKQDFDGYSALHIAAKISYEFVKLLLQNHAYQDAKTQNDDLPLHLAASSGNLEAVTILSNGEFRVNIVNKDNYTPIKLAEMNGHKKVVEFLKRNSGGSPSKIPRFTTTKKLSENDRKMKSRSMYNLSSNKYDSVMW